MSKVELRGDAVLAEVAARGRTALDEFDARAAGRAQKSLRPGRGVRTGAMRRATQAFPATVQGRKIVGALGTAGIPYTRVFAKRVFNYVAEAVEAEQPQAGAILRRHMQG